MEGDTVPSVLVTGSSMLCLSGCYKKSAETCTNVKNVSWDFPPQDPESRPPPRSQRCAYFSDQAVSWLWAAHDTVQHHAKMLS